MEAPYLDHRICLEAIINDVYDRRALIDTGSSINVIPLGILDMVKISRCKIVKKKDHCHQIQEFGRKWDMSN